MPKIKTNKTAAKRFKRSRGGKGDVVKYKNNKHHGRTGRKTRLLNRTNNKRKVSDSDKKRIIKLIE
jgi:ribosomal protein L35